jgi:desulfoferrodoxin (superoxide reductase-like protein)
VLIEEYFQSIGSYIADCPHVTESQIRNDKRSFYIGVVEGEIRFTDNSFLHFIEFINVKEGVNRYKYSYHYQDKAEKVVFRYDMAPRIIKKSKRSLIINIWVQKRWSNRLLPA